MGKRKRIWASEEERDAWEAHVDETLARLWNLASRAQAELDSTQGREPAPQPRPPRRQPPLGRTFGTRDERVAWEAHVDETLARLKALAEKGLAEVEARERAGEARSTPDA